MSKLRILIIVGCCAALVPTLAAAGDSAGSCFLPFIAGSPESGGALSLPSDAEGFGIGAECIDGWTLEECQVFGGEWDWQPISCVERDTPFTWDGSCFVPNTQFGDVCVVLWIDPKEEITSQQLCEGQVKGTSPNTWFNDTVCGGVPVPAAPKAALALMMLVLLAGSLGVLAFKAPSA